MASASASRSLKSLAAESPLVLTAGDEGEERVVAEFVEVVG